MSLAASDRASSASQLSRREGQVCESKGHGEQSCWAHGEL